MPDDKTSSSARPHARVFSRGSGRRLLLLTLAALALPVSALWASGAEPPSLVIFGLLALLPAIELAVAVGWPRRLVRRRDLRGLLGALRARPPRRGALRQRWQWSLASAVRATLVPPAALATLVYGWTLPPAQAALASSFVVVVVALPGLTRGVAWLHRERRVLAAGDASPALSRGLEHAGRQCLMGVALLPHRALVALEPRTSGEAALQPLHAASFEPDLGASYQRMAPVVLVAGGALVIVLLAQPASLLPSLPFLTMWLASPLVVPAPRAHATTPLVARRKSRYVPHHEHRDWRPAAGPPRRAQGVRRGARVGAVPRPQEPVDGGCVGGGRAARAVPLGPERGR